MSPDLIERIIAAPHADQPWAPLFGALSDLAPGAKTMIRFTHMDRSDPSIIKTSADGAPDRLADLYRTRYRYMDPVPYSGMNAGALYQYEDLIDREVLVRSAYYSKWCAPNGFTHAFFCYLGRHEGVDAWLAGSKSEKFSSDEFRSVQSIIPYLTVAARSYCKTERLQSQTRLLSGGLNRIGVGAALLDKDASIMAADSEARRILNSGGDFAQSGAKLRLSGNAGALLKQALAGIEACSDVAPLISVRTEAGAQIQILICALESARDWPSGASAIAYFSPVSVAISKGACERLRVTYGLSASEAKLALRLAAGQDLPNAAKALGITHASAQTYCKRVFSKTGVGRQADLVRLVLTSVARFA